ncbi:MAG TPA: hypothetical protein VJP80_06605 [Candidatus Saccharimonadales bacterium]|nr:hypothetical protein [Candidatus Saccharimonadales bacterium]
MRHWRNRPSLRPLTNDRRAVIWLGVISVVTHAHWLFDPRVFTSGDWWFISLQKYRDFVSFSPIWVTDGFGGTSATPGFYLIRFFEGVLTLAGSSFAFNEKLFFFVPITFVGTFGTYLFLRQYFKEWLSFVGAIVFAFNTAMLFNYAGALTIAVADALTPITLYCFRRLLVSPRNPRLLWASAFLFAIMSAYEVRIALLVLAMAGGLVLYNTLMTGRKWEYLRERLWPLAKFGLVLTALQAFWLLPYIVGSRAGVTFSNLLGQSLFVSFSNVQNALTLYHPFWTGARPATFVVQQIPLYAWLIPLAAFGGLLFRRQRVHKEVGYWALLGVVGLFLVKQVNQPLVEAYPWLFAHIPGFAAFREASKFYLLIALSYAVLIPYTLAGCKQWLERHVHWRPVRVPTSLVLYIALSVGVVLLFAVNMLPLLTGSLRTLYIPRQMPNDYATLNTFVGKQTGYFRLLWMPTVPRWAAQTSVHPSLSATNVSQGAWLTSLSTNNLGAGATLRDKAGNMFSQMTSNSFLDRASVKYVVVPLRDTANEDDFIRNYGDDRQYFINQLTKATYLRRVNIGTAQLAVYENTGYQPHVSTAAEVQDFALSADTPFNSLYGFTMQQLGQPFNFIGGGERNQTLAQVPHTQITDPFQSIMPTQVTSAGVRTTLLTGTAPVLYRNTTAQDIRYTLQKGVFTLYGKPRDGLSVNGQPAVQSSGSETVLAAGKLLPQVRYVLAIDGSLLAIDPHKDGSSPLGVRDGPIALFAIVGENAVPDGSFEQGLWQAHVEDCNAYDNGAILDMSTNNQDATDGKQSLQLESDAHTACTTSPASALHGNQYIFSLAYRVVGGQTAGYRITFDDAHKTTVQKDLPASGRWRTYQSALEVPAGAIHATVTLLGYPDYRFLNHAVTNYDNVQLLPAVGLVNLPAPAPSYTTATLPTEQQVTLSFASSAANQGKNLVPDGSFEQGLWQQKPQDCDNYDSEPDISMGLSSGNGGGRSLELRARRHAACTSATNIAIEPRGRYLLSFDYQSPDTSRASYSVSFDDPGATTVQGTIHLANTGWHHFTKQLSAPLAAHHANITFYAYGADSGTDLIINRYDNVSLSAIPTVAGEYFAVNKPSVSTAQPATVTATKQGAARESIYVGHATKPFYLSMSESYNPLWRLELANSNSTSVLAQVAPWSRGTAVPSVQHFRLNDFENGWYVDPAALCSGNPDGCTKQQDGSYDLHLVAEFTPQHWLYVGASISSVTAIGGGWYLLRYVRAQRQKGRWIWHGR